MGETFSEIAAKASSDLSEKGITRSGTPLDNILDVKPDKDKEVKVVVPEVEGEEKVTIEKDTKVSKETPVVADEPSAKKGTYNHKINQMTARIKNSDARGDRLEAELKTLRESKGSEAGLEKLAKILSKDKVDGDEDNDDSVGDETKPVTLEDIQKMLDDRDTKLKDSLVKEESASAVNKLNSEFADLIKKDFEKDYDNELDALTDSAQEQVDSLIELYKSNPERWLNQIKTVGAKEFADRLAGKATTEKSAEEVLEASKSLDMEGNTVHVSKEEAKGIKFSDIAKSVSDKLALAGITRK